MKVHEKKRDKKKNDRYALKKNLQMERDHTKGVSIHHIHTRAHLDLIV